MHLIQIGRKRIVIFVAAKETQSAYPVQSREHQIVHRPALHRNVPSEDKGLACVSLRAVVVSRLRESATIVYRAQACTKRPTPDTRLAEQLNFSLSRKDSWSW